MPSINLIGYAFCSLCSAIVKVGELEVADITTQTPHFPEIFGERVGRITTAKWLVCKACIAQWGDNIFVSISKHLEEAQNEGKEAAHE